MAVDDFFLPAADATDDYLFRQPKRENATVEALIDGRPTFQAMEIAIAGAVTSVHMTLWRLQPGTELTARGRVWQTSASVSGRRNDHKRGSTCSAPWPHTAWMSGSSSPTSTRC